MATRMLAKWAIAFIVITTIVMRLAAARAATAGAPAQAEGDRRKAVAAHGMVAAAHPLAARAGLEVLQRGGNAVDAAITTALTLGVVEPNASGLSGGGFALVYLAKEGRSYVVDFREAGPAKARPDVYPLTSRNKALNDASATGYRAVAVPGELRGLEMLHQKFGSQPWADLFQPAIQQSEAGLVVSETLSQILADEFDRLEKSPAMPWLQKNFYKDGLPAQAGDVIRNPELTATLKKIASGGADVFYKGELAEAIAKEFAEKGSNWITQEDLANYRAILREPVKGTYRDCTVITLPPPSSGGLALLELLNILEGYDLAHMKQGSTEYLALCIEAQKLAFADRAQYMADPAFAKVPVAGLLDKSYAAERRKSIAQQKPNRASAGSPAKYESGSTTSFSVVDKDGNIVTITQTLNHFMGAGVVPEGTGILMNDEMDDFDLQPDSVNAPAAGKRPLSSMAPLIVLRDRKPFLTAGSPGATRIITALANIVIGVVDFKLDLPEAILAPRFHNGNLSETAVEARFPREVLTALETRGYKLAVKKEMDLYFGGAQGIMFLPDGKLLGMGDPRRDGLALGY
jgi:gamma-glutamyltranspeptidase / glutathione hydrolase